MMDLILAHGVCQENRKDEIEQRLYIAVKVIRMKEGKDVGWFVCDSRGEIETGKRNITLESAIKIAKALKAEVFSLLK